jgi:transcriptional regulator with XRE-family HTH domain
MALSDLLVSLRTERNLSRREVATSLDITVAYVGLLESGHRIPTRRVLKAMAEFFGYPLETLERTAAASAPSREPKRVERTTNGASKRRVARIALVTGGTPIGTASRATSRPFAIGNPGRTLQVADVTCTVHCLLRGNQRGLEVIASRRRLPAVGLAVKVTAPSSGRSIRARTDVDGRFRLLPTADLDGETKLKVTVVVDGARGTCTLRLPSAALDESPPAAAGTRVGRDRHAVGTSLSAEDQALRQAVEQFNGELKHVAAHLGLPRSSVSLRLNSIVHLAWWSAFKTQRAKRRARQRKRGTRVRSWLRDKRRYPSDIPFTQRDMLERVKKVARRRGHDAEQALNIAHGALTQAKPDFDALFHGDWWEWTDEQIANSLLVLADALGLTRGPGPLLWVDHSVVTRR